ncbi:hypothetical protein [Planctomycetes bacterium K23_9]|uniref:Uncharacterized protein n=1 Tax=Stieleria marina TaxID=1930275 RepID=A0A517P3F2_9BACT|nr:hypothetical protein K239x_59300 [Planctomycetes bacterium K23_9]
MINRQCVCVVLLTATAVCARAEAPRTVIRSARVLPESTVAFAELTDVKGLLATIFDHPLRQKIESLPSYQQATGSNDYQKFVLGRDMIENLFGMPWREAIETFAAKGVSIAVDGPTRGVAVIVQGDNAESMKLFRDKLLTLGSMAKSGKKVQKVSYRGVDAHRIEDVRMAVVADQLLLTNHSDLGKAILDRMLGDELPLLQNADRFQSSLKTRNAGATGWGFVDVAMIREAGVGQNVFEDQINQPIAELLFGGIQETLQDTPFVSASFTARTERMFLRLSAPHEPDSVDEKRHYYFGADGHGRGLKVAEVPEELFTLSTHRDFAEMWLRAGDLFDERINDEFAKADATLTTLFAGRDFGEDILGSFNPEVAFVSSRQTFSGTTPIPTIKLPAFGVVMTMKDSAKMTRELRRTFQSMIGFFNVVGAMNGQRQLELDMEKIGDDVELVSSFYVPEQDDRQSTAAPIVFNFSPTVGFAGDRFVLASTQELAKELSTAKTSNPNQMADNTAAKLQASILQRVLTDNREQLIAQNMLTDGNSREEAEASIGLLLEVVGYLDDASIRMGQADGELQLDFSVRLDCSTNPGESP